MARVYLEGVTKKFQNVTAVNNVMHIARRAWDTRPRSCSTCARCTCSIPSRTRRSSERASEGHNRSRALRRSGGVATEQGGV